MFKNLAVSILWPTLTAAAQVGPTLQNKQLSVRVRTQDGAYEIFARGLDRPVLISRVDAQINQQWIRSSDYPRHETSEASFQDVLGRGQALTLTFSGLAGKPDLVCKLRLYEDQTYGDISVLVRNGTRQSFSVQAIRVADAMGNRLIDLGASSQDDRVLAESVSEDPTIQIGGLADAPKGVYFGVRNILIYNLASKLSLELSALTSERFLTISRLRVHADTIGLFVLRKTQPQVKLPFRMWLYPLPAILALAGWLYVS